MIMGADKSHNLPSTTGDPGKCIAEFKSLRSKPGNQWWRFQSGFAGLGVQQTWGHSRPEARRRWTSQLGQSGRSNFDLPLAFASIQALRGLEEAHPWWGGQKFYSAYQFKSFWKYSHRRTQK